MAIYHRRLNPKPAKPKKWNKAYRPRVNKKAPKIKKKETYGKKNKTPTTPTTTILSASINTRIAALEIKLAFGHYTYKYLQDILANGGKITIDAESAPSLVSSVEKMVAAGYLQKESKKDKQVVYQLTQAGFDGVKEILANMKLRNPKTLKSLNRY